MLTAEKSTAVSKIKVKLNLTTLAFYYIYKTGFQKLTPLGFFHYIILISDKQNWDLLEQREPNFYDFIVSLCYLSIASFYSKLESQVITLLALH